MRWIAWTVVERGDERWDIQVALIIDRNADPWLVVKMCAVILQECAGKMAER